LSRGLVEMVPDYADTARLFVRLGSSQPSDDEATHIELVRSLGDGAVTALAEAPAQNANTFVTAGTAARDDSVV
jgi:hypothetical protein